MEIRRLGLDDASSLEMVHASAFPEPEAWSAASFVESLRRHTVLGLGAFNDSALAGAILLQVLPPEAEILTLAVSPDARRTGVATRLSLIHI